VGDESDRCFVHVVSGVHAREDGGAEEEEVLLVRQKQNRANTLILRLRSVEQVLLRSDLNPLLGEEEVEVGEGV